jgi:hypothetical protein
LLVAVTLTACGSGSTGGSSAAAATLLTAMQQDIDSHCSTSGLQTCLETRLGYAYPGSLDADKSRTCIAAREKDPKFQYNIVFDTKTLTSEPQWTPGTGASAPDWVLGSQAVDGDVYSVQLREIVIAYGVESTNSITGHVAVKGGRVYWFPSFCS